MFNFLKEYDLIFNFVWKIKIFPTCHLKAIFDVVCHIERKNKVTHQMKWRWTCQKEALDGVIAHLGL